MRDAVADGGWQLAGDLCDLPAEAVARLPPLAEDDDARSVAELIDDDRHLNNPARDLVDLTALSTGIADPNETGGEGGGGSDGNVVNHSIRTRSGVL